LPAWTSLRPVRGDKTDTVLANFEPSRFPDGADAQGERIAPQDVQWRGWIVPGFDQGAAQCYDRRGAVRLDAERDGAIGADQLGANHTKRGASLASSRNR
jgi:hypothetical protein